MGVMDMVQQHLGPDQIAQISKQLGIDPATAQKAVDAALPMIVGATAHTASQPGGAAAIQTAADSHAGGGIMDTIGGMLGSASGAGGAGGLLNSMLGNHTTTVTNGVQQSSGIDPAKATALVAMLAPIVMTAISHHQSTTPGAAGQGMGSILAQEAQKMQANSGSSPMGGMLGQILGKFGA